MAPETVSRSSPPPQSEPADNPIVAVGRKVKSVLGTQQQPSVRIVREPAKRRGLPVPKGVADKLAPHLSQHGKSHTPENRAELAEHYAAHAESHRSGEGKEKENKKEQETEGRMSRVRTSIQSLFGAKGNDTEEQLQHEYDADTVDLLDVVGKYQSAHSGKTNLTVRRSRGIDSFDPHQRPEFALRAQRREIREPPACIQAFRTP